MITIIIGVTCYGDATGDPLSFFVTSGTINLNLYYMNQVFLDSSRLFI